MFKKFLKIMMRNIYRHKGYSFINISGLAIGIACCILIMLWVQDELSYDRFHENARDLYVATFSNGSKVVPSALSGFLASEYGEVMRTSRFLNIGRNLLKYKTTKIMENNGIMVDPDFLKMFTMSLVKGNEETALQIPESILVSETLAKKYFGTEDPINQTITFGTRQPLKVTGVFKDYPANSHFRCAYILPLELSGKMWNRNLNTWEWNNIRAYVQLRNGTVKASVDSKISDIVERHRPQDQRQLSLQPITRLRLDPYNNSGGTITYVYLFSAISFFILLIACINFINLTTARFSNRAKEVGIRKTFGAFRIHLIRQFFGETLSLTLIASAAGTGMVLLFLPMFNNLTGKVFTWESLSSQTNILGIAGMIILTVFLAGSYPALFLSRYQPVKVLRGKAITGMKGMRFRKILVVVQFSLSVFLILSSLMIFRQVHYLRNHDVGYDRENIVYFGIGSRFKQNIDTIKTELLSNPGILSISLVDVAPYRWQSNAGFGDVHWEGKANQKVKMVMTSVDYDYLDTFGVEIVQGRFFSKEFSTDPSQSFVINQAAVRAMEMEDPIGKELKVWDYKRRIVGVVKDYHFESLHSPIIPMAMRIDPNGYQQVCVRISPHHISGSVEFLRKKWKEIYPEYPFEYRFLDDTLQGLYRSEEAIGKIINVFTFLAILISCLGIFGLSSFTAEQRTKEIGIRKVLGATIGNVFILISKEFAILVFFANLVTWPLAYFFMIRWLQTFAYRISLSWWTFLLTGILVFAISILTISWQIIRAATNDPVRSLRHE